MLSAGRGGVGAGAGASDSIKSGISSFWPTRSRSGLPIRLALTMSEKRLVAP
jgi:hypothetical protein